ncbi:MULTISPECIES: SMC family ATPase [Massilia]|uniref:AAA family ATPase n=1 Tax=Massilia TaxID=149698 RepID=UPI0004E395A0|nr:MULTISPECIES: SMC family ATPase [Massilia]KFC72597.1 chromosome segregation protein [Massilia sp. LC238]
MKPLKLSLQGFTGIFAAFGRDSLVLDLQTIPQDAALVALVGPNGAGKSTILDSLHPYRVMPSRSSTLGPGGFSYWTQIHGATAMKELLWENDGIRYRTLLSFKTTGKTQKSDCYLYQWDAGKGDWTPVQLADGTLSDGKSSTYDHLVDAILGPPEKFFTAHFSAQGRKTIASYGAGDIKSILASVLNLQGYRELAAKAGQVGKYLRQQLDGLNSELAEARDHDNTAAVLEREVIEVDGRMRAVEADEVAAHANVNGAREALAGLLAKRDAQANTAEEVRFLNEQIGSVVTKAASSKASVSTQFARDQDRHQAEATSARAAIATAQNSVQSSETEVRRLNAVLADKDAIAQAVARLPEHKCLIEQIDASVDADQATLAGAAALRTELNVLIAQQAKLSSEGQAKTIVIQKLTETAALVEKVPCKGSEMQLSCPLMEQANNAKRDVPAHQAEQSAKRAAYQEIALKVKDLQSKVAGFDKIEAEVRDAQKKRRTAATALDADNRVAARAPLIADAEARLPVLAQSIQEQRQVIAAATDRLTQATNALAAIESEKAQALALIETNALAEQQVLQDRLAKLEKPVSDAEVEAYQSAVSRTGAALVEVQARARSLTEQKVSLIGKLEAARALVARSGQVKEQAERLQEEIAKWKLAEKGLGNDGCVALSIDDSGPEIAAICNSLLSDCFEGRFIVRLDTQSETKTGMMKETFDVKVFDGHRGTEKSLGDMSGGEEILVNECLTRAVALYASQSSTTRCETLFTDETDGALDPEAKRTFMQMKRAVLKQGGYEREFFITHTPELWEMADHKIMVAEL